MVESFHLVLEHLICSLLKIKLENSAKAVFFDRDGVINELVYYTERGIIDSPRSVEQFRLCPRTAQALLLLNQKDYRVIVVSNQPGVAKNYFAPETLQAMDAKMKTQLRNQGAFLDQVYYCLHHPEGQNPDYAKTCDCRKPQPGLLFHAAKDFGLDLSQCYMVGDNLTDIKAGRNAGCKTLLIGRMKCELCHLMDDEGTRPDMVVGDILDAVKAILKEDEG